jgi:hypothetical protein
MNFPSEGPYPHGQGATLGLPGSSLALWDNLICCPGPDQVDHAGNGYCSWAVNAMMWAT